MRFFKTVAVALICVAAAGAAFSAGYATHLVLGTPGNAQGMPAKQLTVRSSDPTPAESATFRVFWEALHLLQQNFLGNVPPPQKVAYSAIRGVLADLGDAHTVFIEPRARQLERDENRGRFGGIGVSLYQRADDHSIVLTPSDGSPAAKAGVRDGDTLVSVDDTAIDMTKMNRDDVVALIRGPVGTVVHIAVTRADAPDRFAFEITRAEFETPSVEWRLLDDRAPHTGYLRITMFTERTGAEVSSALQTLIKDRGATRLVLDLRDNPGGLLDAAIDVSSQFLDGGIVMYEQNRDGTEKSYPVLNNGIARDIPLTVLVNGGSASAAEIVSGALHDRGRADLIGEKTYGKGSVQLVFDLSDGSSIHITVARWLTPERHQIDGAGIKPDEEITMSEEDRVQGRDPQLSAAVAHLIAAAPK
jgi:carboxyl-terminal processing protease